MKPILSAPLGRVAPLAALGAALLMCLPSANAQMYKWIDAKGKIHYSDKPPPPSAREAPIKAGAGGSVTVPLPFELAEAARNHPVVLYTGGACGGCDQGRTYLRSRGIPFVEKTVFTAADDAKLREAGSPGQVPLLLVGRSKSVGFETSAWAALLSDAGYPSSRVLPSNYQYPPAVSAAPAPLQAAAAERPAPADRAPERRLPRMPPPPPPEPTAPPGFKF